MPHDHAVLYVRDLPGGGFVAIEGQPDGSSMRYRGLLCVERRSDPDRRDGHEAPVVVEAEGTSQGEVYDRLLAIANSNVEVAAALLRWQSAHGRRHPALDGDPAPGAAGDGASDVASGVGQPPTLDLLIAEEGRTTDGESSATR